MSDLAPEEQLRKGIGFLHASTAHRPKIGIILGSGLGSVADCVELASVFDFAEIPHLCPTTVAGHPGKLVVGTWSGVPVAVLLGRLHAYEGYSSWQVTAPVRLLGSLGVQTLIVTNAAGALNPDFCAGDLMVISDHINLPGLAGDHPLAGPGAVFGNRFVGMQEAYDAELRRLALASGRRLNLPVRPGVYIMVNGPSYETNAELRMLRMLGGDAVGMSTASEVIVAIQLGLKVLGVSGITNQASVMGHHAITHAEVLAQGQELAPRLGTLLAAIVVDLRDR